MGWAAWFVRFFFLSYRSPRSVLGPGRSLFARSFAFLLPSRRLPVLGHGVSNRAAKLRHGTERFLCSFVFCRPADALLISEPGGGQGNLATHTVVQDCMFCLIFFVMHGKGTGLNVFCVHLFFVVIWLLTQWHRTVCFVFFSL